MAKKNLILLFIIVFSFSCSQKIDYTEAGNFITTSEKAWAQAIVIGDTSAIKMIMADDFIGMNSKGKTYDKQTLIREAVEAAHLYTAEAYNIKIKFYGTTAIAQGGETWTKFSDSTSTKSVWTDTWIYRNNKWQVIAAMDLKLDQKNNQVPFSAEIFTIPSGSGSADPAALKYFS
ncbi:MAG: nuclear transport factor 2 family protein [Sphingobacteriales bacterium]|nr:nuclear transport factor 2 family protein [Sphingobacteriales bacterium]MBI3718744.1 nuclear transport factor 2 family protein [Sphingobacteriales bacterium]